MSLSKALPRADDDIDWDSLAKAVITTGLGEIPYVGSIVSALADILWPSGDDVWNEIKDKVEALIKEKISELVYKQVQDSLKGLKNNIDDYICAAKTGEPPSILSQKWIATNALFLHDLPSFQSKDYELLLLPLFAQFANLHLTLLRDGVFHGKDKMGWNDTTVDNVTKALAARIAEYTKYTEETYTKGLEDTKKKAPHNKQKTEPFKTVNKFVREMTLTVIDYKVLWKYFDFKAPVDAYLNREIYTDPRGTADDTGITMPAMPPTQPISNITVWGWDRIDACKVDYPSQGGPDGATSTGRMGDSSGGASNPPHGGSFNLTTRGPIVAVCGRSGDILNAWWFHFKDGSVSNTMGGNYHGGSEYKFQYDGEILSSIKIMGVSDFYGSANAVVYGFKFERKTTPTSYMLHLLYKTSTIQLTAKELLAKFTGNNHMVEDVERWIKEYDWDKDRSLHWKESTQM